MGFEHVHVLCLNDFVGHVVDLVLMVIVVLLKIFRKRHVLVVDALEEKDVLGLVEELLISQAAVFDERVDVSPVFFKAFAVFFYTGSSACPQPSS